MTGARAYQSALRTQQAQQTKLRVIASAARLFAEVGYARTTLAKIAADAGVSIETVQGQGSKAQMMIAAVEYASFGVTGDQSLLELEQGRQFMRIEQCDPAIEFLADLQTQVHQRSARVTQALIAAAAADAELDGYLSELLAGVKRQINRVMSVCCERGWLRQDIAFDELVETATVLCSIEVYFRITVRDGWSVDAYRSWLARMLRELTFVDTAKRLARRGAKAISARRKAVDV